jgi:uncharacterized protein
MSAGGRRCPDCADLTDPEALAKVEARVTIDDALGLLVNNAGFGSYKPSAFIGMDDFIDILVRAVTRLTRAALPGMIRRGAGGIVNSQRYTR